MRKGSGIPTEDVTPQMETANFLENRRIKVKAIAGANRWGSVFEDDRPNDPFMYNGVKKSYDLPNKEGTLVKKNILDAYKKVATADYPDLITEQEFFERKLFLEPGELSIYNQKSRFWADFRVTVPKEGITLDLRDPMDMIKYKVLLANTNTIAPNWEARFSKASYEFVLVDESVVIEVEKEKGDLEDRASIEYLKIKDNMAKMSDILRLKGFKVPADTKLSFLQNEVRKLSKQDPKSFILLVTDPMLEYKVMLRNAVRVKALEMPRVGQYALPGGTLIGSEQETIKYLEDPENQNIKQRIINQIEAAK